MKEFDLLHRVFERNDDLPGSVVIPPGDDMGAVRIGGKDVLVTVDQVAEGVHFDLHRHSLARVGRKVITRNLSDVAAMAAKPDGAVVSICLPRDFGEQQALELFHAMRETGAHYHCPLFGGDITMWDSPLQISATVLAHCDGHKPVLRSGAKVGDNLYATGTLGGSALEVDDVIHHLDFEPRVAVAGELCGRLGDALHAMIDLSDGLAGDLGHICASSGVGANVMIEQLPISPAARLAARKSGRAAYEHALGDGEDYELCFAVDERANVPKMIDDVPVTLIGKCVDCPDGRDEKPITLTMPDGRVEPLRIKAWQHE